MIDSKLTKLFLGQAKVLQKQLEKVLEKDSLQSALPKKEFEIEVLRSPPPFSIPDHAKENEVMIQILKQSVSFFQSGLLTWNDDLKTVCIAAFEDGVFFPLKGHELELDFQLPNLKLLEIKRVQSKKMRENLEKLNIIKNEDTEVFVLKPYPQFSFLVSARLGEPWLKMHMENYQKSLLKICGDL
jgi:hypothetical protein